MVLAILITFLSFFVRWRDRDMPRRSHSRKPNGRMPARNSKPPPIQLIAPSGFLSIAGNLLLKRSPFNQSGPLCGLPICFHSLCLMRFSSKKKFSAPNLHCVLKRSVNEKRNAHTKAGARPDGRVFKAAASMAGHRVENCRSKHRQVSSGYSLACSCRGMRQLDDHEADDQTSQ